MYTWPMRESQCEDVLMPWAPKTHSQRQAERRGGRRTVDQFYEQKRRADPVLAASKRFRNSRRWQKVRDLHKRQFPLCSDPFGAHERMNETVEVAHVHHIVGIDEAPDLACHVDNLASVCSWCHSRLEAMRRAGKDTKHLFDKERSDADS